MFGTSNFRIVIATLRWLAAIVLLPSALAPLRGESIDQRYVAHLRERGMHRLAEVYCRRRLESAELDDRQRVELAIELSLVAASQAYDAPAGQRDRYWQQAYAALEGWLATAERPYRLLAELQDALNMLDEAELNRLEQVGLSDTAATEAVRSRARQAIASLRSIADQVETLRRQVALGQVRKLAEFTERELAGLQRSVSLALARAYREQALTYPADSPDQVNALQQAAESLAAIAAMSPADALAWQARVTLANTLAELGQVNQGLAALEQWRSETVPPQFADELLAAEARLLAKTGRAAEALATLSSSATKAASPAVDLARLELLIASDSPDVAAIESLLATIRERHAPRFVRQAEALVGQSFASAAGATTAGGKMLAAEHFYHAGQLAAAIAAYDEAAELYRQQQERGRAFNAERAAAAVVQQRGDFVEAAERFRRLALGSVDRDGSATDHREAILSLAAATRDAADTSTALANYLELCREHLRHWSAGQSADEVRWWLAQALASREQWQATLDVLLAIDQSSPYYEQATALLATTYRQRIAEAADLAERQSLMAAAVDRLQPTVVGSGNSTGWPTAWTNAQRTCALELARLKLDAGDHAYAAAMLQAALLRGTPPASQAYRDRAAPVLAMALVGSGNTAEAIALLRESAHGSDATVSLESLASRLTDQLAEYSQTPDTARTERAAVGQLLLAVLEVAGDRTATWQVPAARYRAAALAAVANDSEARALYQSLAKQLPQNGDVQEEYARLLAASDNFADHEAALAAWGKIESGSRRGGDRWHRARQARIQLLTQLGRRDEAQKLEKLTQLLGGR